jgi:hypothetical protein
MNSWAGERRGFELLRRGKGKRRPTLRVYLNNYPILKENSMRTVFTIEVATDVGIDDDKRRAAFVGLMKKASKTLFAQTAMLSDRPNIDISVQVEDSIHGVQEVDLFEGENK